MSDQTNIVDLLAYRAERAAKAAAKLAADAASSLEAEHNELQQRFYAAMELAMAGDVEGVFESFRIGLQVGLNQP